MPKGKLFLIYFIPFLVYGAAALIYSALVLEAAGFPRTLFIWGLVLSFSCFGGGFVMRQNTPASFLPPLSVGGYAGAFVHSVGDWDGARIALLGFVMAYFLAAYAIGFGIYRAATRPSREKGAAGGVAPAREDMALVYLVPLVIYMAAVPLCWRLWMKLGTDYALDSYAWDLGFFTFVGFLVSPICFGLANIMRSVLPLAISLSAAFLVFAVMGVLDGIEDGATLFIIPSFALAYFFAAFGVTFRIRRWRADVRERAKAAAP
ncbi:MAG: hypothetical protein LBG71_03065 [Clostridiales Family XIII bacterium]|jgi:hypothetical protein|nr:hypothetical protein [Clostridiales Family XIII bacterium]